MRSRAIRGYTTAPSTPRLRRVNRRRLRLKRLNPYRRARPYSGGRRTETGFRKFPTFGFRSPASSLCRSRRWATNVPDKWSLLWRPENRGRTSEVSDFWFPFSGFWGYRIRLIGSVLALRSFTRSRATKCENLRSCAGFRLFESNKVG